MIALKHIMQSRTSSGPSPRWYFFIFRCNFFESDLPKANRFKAEFSSWTTKNSNSSFNEFIFTVEILRMIRIVCVVDFTEEKIIEINSERRQEKKNSFFTASLRSMSSDNRGEHRDLCFVNWEIHGPSWMIGMHQLFFSNKREFYLMLFVRREISKLERSCVDGSAGCFFF